MSEADPPLPASAGITAVLAHRLAHEVRSPLGVVQGALEQIIAREDGSATMGRLAHRSCARLIRLADRLDRIAALEAPTPPSPPGPAALSPVLGAAVERATAACGRSRIEVATDIADPLDVPPALAEALAIAVEEVVHNAIAHARAHVEVASSVVQGDASTATSPAMLRITVTDDGRGTDAALATFRPPRAAGSGLGLGLWLARSALTGHQATLELLPAPDTGTRAQLTVTLPGQETE